MKINTSLWHVDAVAVLGQVGEGHAVVGEHDVDLVGKHLDDIPQEG